MSLSITVPLMISTLVCASVADAADFDGVLAALAAAKNRELCCQSDCDWQFELKRGVADDLNSAIAGRASTLYPVDLFAGRWMSCRGDSFYSLVGAENQIDVQVKDGFSELRPTSIAWMSTANSRLQYQAELAGGQIQLARKSLIKPWGPYGVPVHALVFGVGRIDLLMDRIEDGAVEVTHRKVALDSGTECDRFAITDGELVQHLYFAVDRNRCLMGATTIQDGAIVSESRVTRVELVTHDGRQEWLPADISMWRIDNGTFPFTRVVSQSVSLSPADRKQMKLDLSGGAFSLYPENKLMPSNTTFVEIDNLDSFVESMQSDFESARLLADEPSLVTGQPKTSWLFVVVLIANLLGAVVLFVIYRRKRSV